MQLGCAIVQPVVFKILGMPRSGGPGALALLLTDTHPEPTYATLVAVGKQAQHQQARVMD